MLELMACSASPTVTPPLAKSVGILIKEEDPKLIDKFKLKPDVLSKVDVVAAGGKLSNVGALLLVSVLSVNPLLAPVAPVS